MKLRYAGMLLAVCASVLLAGCVTTEDYAAYREELDQRNVFQNYADSVRDLFCDASDVLSVELAMGEGFGVQVQPTKLLNAGFMFSDVMKFGYRNRGLGFYREVRKEGGLSWTYYRDMEFDPIVGNAALFERERLLQDFTIRHNSDRHWMDIGVDAHVLLVGASVFVSPKETVDFAGTLVMFPVNVLLRPPLAYFGLHFPDLDLSNDDISARARKKHNVTLINSPEKFAPTELLDDLMRLGY